MAQIEQVDLLIDRRDLSDFTGGNELRLLAELGTIKSSASSIDRPADPDIAKTRKKAGVQAQKDSAIESVKVGVGNIHRAMHANGSACFFDNPTNYLLMFIAFLLFLLLITRD